MAASRDTTPTTRNMARLSARCESFQVEMQVTEPTLFVLDPIEVELFSIDRNIWKELLATLQVIEKYHKSFNFLSDWHFHESLCDQLRIAQEPWQPNLCKLLVNLSLAMHQSITPPTGFEKYDPMPWYDNLSKAVKAWDAIPKDEKPYGNLLLNIGKMLRRLRRQVVLGDEGKMQFEERRAAFIVRSDEEEERLCAEEKLAEDKLAAEMAAREEAAKENVTEENAVEGEEEIEIAALALETRRESCLSTVEPTPFDSLVDTPNEDYLSGNSSVIDEDEEKGLGEVDEDQTIKEPELSTNKKWSIETIGMIIGMLNLSVEGPVYEDGDRI